MVNFGNCKIYKIYSDECDKYYIGSTCEKYLSNRLAGHKTHYNQWKNEKYHYVTSFEILQYDDARIELIEHRPCADVHEQKKIEGEYIKQYSDEIVNKRVEGRTKKQYRIDNADKLNKKAKQYYEDHIEEKKKYDQQHYQENADKIKDRAKQYREQNKDKIKEHSSEKVQCECGATLSRCHITRHKKSAKHIKLMEDK